MTEYWACRFQTAARLDQTLREGLRRPSAAWFRIGSEPEPQLSAPTAAAGVYLALAARGRAALLAGAREAASLSDVWRQHEARPVLLLFRDVARGGEQWRRYYWVHSPDPGWTEPYTKVERAGRSLSFQTGDVRCVMLEDEDLDQVASGLPTFPPWAPEEAENILTRRVSRRGPGDEYLAVARICEDVGSVLRAKAGAMA